MSLDSVLQLQTLNKMMRGQFEIAPARSVMILGIAGGNGLEHLPAGKFQKVYGVDVNSAYLKEVRCRYPHLDGVLECLCLDLTKEAGALPHADLLLADLLVEYIGCACFQQAVKKVSPRFVSCIIQLNTGREWVSASPYLHVFDRLNEVHHDMDEASLQEAVQAVGYRHVRTLRRPLPNGKQLVQQDFEKTP